MLTEGTGARVFAFNRVEELARATWPADDVPKQTLLAGSVVTEVDFPHQGIADVPGVGAFQVAADLVIVIREPGGGGVHRPAA